MKRALDIMPENGHSPQRGRTTEGDDDGSALNGSQSLEDSTEEDINNDSLWNSDGEDSSMLIMESDSASSDDTHQQDSDSDSGNWEGPPKFLQGLKYIKAKRSILKNLQPLQQLCLRAISSNLAYFQRQIRPFDKLPGPVLDMLVWQFESQSLLNRPDVIPLVITEYSRSLPINLQQPGRYPGDQSNIFLTEDFTLLFSHISKVCHEKLVCLRLRLDFQGFLNTASEPHPTMDSFHSLLQTMVDLQEAALNIGTVTNETLLILAENCPQLRKLDVSDNAGVTDPGIEYICGVSVPEPSRKKPAGCLNIAILNLSCTSVTRHGAVTALANLPELYQFDHNKIHAALLIFIQKYGTSKSLKLEELRPRDRHQRYLTDICTIMPNLRSLDIHYESKLKPFYKLKNVQELSFSAPIHLDKTMSLIINFGSGLTKLEICEYKMAIDVSVIGYHCLNLEEFLYTESVPPNPVCSFKLNATHFKQMKSFELGFSQHDDDNGIFPVNVLECILSSPNLQILTFRRFTLPDGIFRTLIEEARSHEQVFSNLRILHFILCELTFERINEIMCVAPRLTKVSMLRCTDPAHVWISMHKTLDSFVKRNKLDIAVFKT